MIFIGDARVAFFGKCGSSSVAIVDVIHSFFLLSRLISQRTLQMSFYFAALLCRKNNNNILIVDQKPGETIGRKKEQCLILKGSDERVASANV